MILLTVLFAQVIIHGFSPTLSHDEHQYIAAALLAGDRSIYRDFFYSQTPYFALSLSRWLAWFPDLSIYGAARAFNLVWSLSFFVALWGLMWRISGAPLLATVLLAGLATSPLLAPAIGLVRNDTMPLFFATVALACMIHVAPGRRRASAILSFLAGLFAAIAFGAKQSYAFLPATLVVFAFLAPTYPDLRSRLTGLVAPLCVGGLLGGAPLAAIASANFSNFLYDTFEYHRTADPVWFARVGRTEQTEVLPRLLIFGKLAFDIYSLTLLLCFLLCAGLIVGRGRGRTRVVDDATSNALYLSTIGLVLAATALLGLAKSIFAQYLAPPLTLATIACAAAVGTVRSVLARSKLEYGAAAAGAALVLLGFGVTASILANRGNTVARLGCVWHQCEWAPSHVRRVAMRLNEILGPGSKELKIATLMSVYPLEAGFGIYDELAGAPFFYRVNDTLPLERRRAMKGVAPGEVGSWLAEMKATVVLTGYVSGYDADLEAGFARFARERGLIPLVVDLRGGYKQDQGSGLGLLWVAPSLIRSAAARSVLASSISSCGSQRVRAHVSARPTCSMLWRPSAGRSASSDDKDQGRRNGGRSSVGPGPCRCGATNGASAFEPLVTACWDRSHSYSGCCAVRCG
ncbi:MAG: ArnT family glycosyltransferase [Geminicoccaceae bacterium]